MGRRADTGLDGAGVGIVHGRRGRLVVRVHCGPGRLATGGRHSSGHGTSDFSLCGGYDSAELPPLDGCSFDVDDFSADAWSSIEVMDFGGDW